MSAKKPVEQVETPGPAKVEENKLIQLGDNAGWERKPALIQLGAKQEK